MNCPCKECERREIGCHGDCDEYKVWSAWNTARNDKRRAEREKQNCRSEAYAKTVSKSLRRKK